MLSKNQRNKQPRYSRTAKIARKFILNQNINRLPVDPFYIAEKNGWSIEKASDIARDLGVSVDFLMRKLIKSKDGAALYCDATDEYKIVYNDEITNFPRIRWTIMHEIGHIVLNHLKDYECAALNRGGLPDETYNQLEEEADFFAGQVLAPPIILHSLNIKSPKDIEKICMLSKEASIYRYKYYLKWKSIKKISFDELLIKLKFSNFINAKHCLTCGFYFVSKDAKYCPICGNNKLIWGEGSMKYRKGIELDKNGRALICPRCGNEEINGEDKYCKICGTYIIQECAGDEYHAGCGYKPASNARYCPMCGSITTFYNQKLLKPWKEEKKELEAENEDIDFDFDFDDTDVGESVSS